jgi:hypothetical protein
MTTIWRKSSYSGGGGKGGEECIELARLTAAVGLRDSKNPEAGHLSLSRAALAGLLDQARSH